MAAGSEILPEGHGLVLVAIAGLLSPIEDQSDYHKSSCLQT